MYPYTKKRLLHNFSVSAAVAIIGEGILFFVYYAFPEKLEGLFAEIIEKLSLFERFNIYDDKYIGYTNVEERNKINTPCVFINDIKYLHKEHSIYLDYLSMIKEGKILGEYELHTKTFNYLIPKEEILKYTTEEDIQRKLKII